MHYSAGHDLGSQSVTNGDVRYFLRFAGLDVSIVSPIRLRFLDRDACRRIRMDKGCPDLTFSYQAVERDSLTCRKPTEGFSPQLSKYSGRGFNGKQSHLLRSPKVLQELPRSELCCDSIHVDVQEVSIAILDFQNKSARSFFPTDHLGYFAAAPFGPGIVALMLPALKRAMVHSSALLLKDKVALLVGPDGGGKTTALSLAVRGSSLSDDQNVLHVEHGRVTVYPTPWTTLPYTGESGPLGGMFLLNQGSNFELEPVKPREVLSYLWKEHEYCSHMLPKPYRMKLFDILHAACTSVPCYRLTFARDFLDWDAVDRAMTSQ